MSEHAVDLNTNTGQVEAIPECSIKAMALLEMMEETTSKILELKDRLRANPDRTIRFKLAERWVDMFHHATCMGDQEQQRFALMTALDVCPGHPIATLKAKRLGFIPKD